MGRRVSPIWLLLACAERWTDARALQPTWERLDRDSDGRVVQAEYDAVALRGATFAQVDSDADGALSRDELQALILRADPVGFATGAAHGPPPGPPADGRGEAGKGRKKEPNGEVSGLASDPPGPRLPHLGSPAIKPLSKPLSKRAVKQRIDAQWAVRLALESLREEVVWKDPAAPVPTEEELIAAAATDSLHTVESRAVLGRLEVAAQAAGLEFPASLTANALAAIPVVATPPPLPHEDPRGPGAARGPVQPRGARPP